MRRRAVRLPVSSVMLPLSAVLASVYLWAKDLASLSGTILDSQTSEPLPGVTLMAEGAKMGRWGFNPNAANLLDWEVWFVQGGKQPGRDPWGRLEEATSLWRLYKKGVSFSMDLSYFI